MLGLQHDAPTPQSLNYSVGIQREIGWGTVLDVTYAGSQTRRIEVGYAINDLPYGTNFIDLHPENINPATGAVLPADFLRPYLGYGTITSARTPARRTTTRCRCSSTAGTSRASSSRWPTRSPRATTRA